MPKIQIISPQPHRGQALMEAEMDAVLRQNNGSGRFYVCAHRGNWKSSQILRRSLRHIRKGLPMGWYAPTFKAIEWVWKDLWTKALGTELFEKSINKGNYTLTIPGHGTVHFYSLVDLSRQAGPTFPFIVNDEAGDTPDGARESILYPILEKGWASYGFAEYYDVGTPNREGNPKNEFYNDLMKAMSGQMPEARGWHVPAPARVDENGDLVPFESPYANPVYTYERLKRGYDAASDKIRWRVEWLVEFLSMDGGQFRGIDKACSLEYVQDEFGAMWLKDFIPSSDGFYQTGIDVGIVNDPTVISVMDRNTGVQVYMHHFLPGGWPTFYEGVKRAMKLFPGRVLMDATGGDAHIDALHQMGFPVEPLKFTPTNKPTMLNQLADFIERGQVQLLNYQQTRFELDKMTRKVRSTGGLTIEGKGAHDDIPMALSLMTYEVPYKAMSVIEQLDQPWWNMPDSVLLDAPGQVSPFHSETLW